MTTRPTDCALRLVVLASLLAACSEPSPAPTRSLAGDDANARAVVVSVTSADPPIVEKDTTLDVAIIGTGFDKGSRAEFALGGVPDARVKVNSTKYLKSTKLVANVTISADAVIGLYDVIVTAAGGTKGIGTEKFEVVLEAEVLMGGTGARAVNAFGEMGGVNSSTVECIVQVAPVYWNAAGSPVALSTGSGCAASVNRINAAGTMLGPIHGGPPRSALWIPNGTGGFTTQELEIGPPEAGAVSNDINDLGDVVAWGQSGPAAIFFWNATDGWRSVQVPAAATRCHARGINNSRTIIGWCSVNGVQDGYYWPNPEAAPIALPRPALSGNVWPSDVNSAGVIVGYVYEARKAVRWTPTNGAYIVEILEDAGGGAAATVIAENGTIGGSRYHNINSWSATSPVYWLPNGELRNLENQQNGGSGSVYGIASGDNGVIIVGSKNSQAVRWILP
jgi:hypothetical protein